jgi:hypothetical protein
MAFTLNRRLAQLIDSNGQLLTGKIPNDYISSDHIADNVITSAMLHTGFTVSASNLGTTLTPTFGNITTTGYIAGPATFTIDPAGVGDNTGTVVIAGNLQVDGTTTTINSTTMTVDDLNLTLASGAANAAAANGAGITVDGASATITYDGTNDAWSFNKNVGIGTSSPDTLLELFADNPVLRLRDSKVKGGSWAAGDALGGLEFYTSDTTGIGTHIAASITTVNGGQDTSTPDAEIVFSTAPYNTVASEKVRIDSSGNVGIGEDNPTSKISVVGGASDAGISIKSGGNAGVDPFRVTWTSGTEGDMFIVDDNGNVGIGTSSPGYQLDLRRNDTGTTPSLGIRQLGTGDASMAFQTTTSPFGFIIGVDASDGEKFKFSTGTENVAAATKLTIDTSGNVGIGTTSPDHNLHIESTDPTLILAQSGSLNNANSGRILFAESPSYTTVDAHFEIKYDGLENHLYFGSPLDQTADLFVVGRNGNVGIGTDDPEAKLAFGGGNANIWLNNDASNPFGIDTAPGELRLFTGNANSYQMKFGKMATDGTTFTSHLTIGDDGSSRGNVGIGTDSPESKLHISNNTFSQDNLTLLTLQNGNGTGDISTPDTFIDFVFKDTNANVTPQARIGAHAGDGGDANTQILEGKGYLTFHTSDTTAESGVVAPPERMRIESDGTVCVNATGTGSLVTKLWAEWNTGTANRGPAIFTNPNTGTAHRVITVNTGGNSKLIVFDKGFASKGSISTNGSSVSYNTTSDYRLKENISYTFDATTRLKQLKPARFNFIEDETNTLVDGFIAHEVSSVVPEAVTGEKDAIDDDNPIYQEMDASKLIPLLVKTIQEMEARISELEG